MRFYFVRHGQSEANVLREISNRGQRHPLTDLGREQAAALAARLRGAGIVRLYSSPLLRARQTADILAAAWGLDYEVTDALREFDCGVAEGRADKEAWDLWHWLVDEWFAGHAETRIEDGESLIDVRDRFVPFAQRLAERYDNEPGGIACIGHGGLYMTMFSLGLGLVDPAWLESQSLSNTGIIEVEGRGGELALLSWDGVQPGQETGGQGSREAWDVGQRNVSSAEREEGEERPV